jgi:hypothetical protein
MNSPDAFNFEVVSIADAKDTQDHIGHGDITEKDSNHRCYGFVAHA